MLSAPAIVCTNGGAFLLPVTNLERDLVINLVKIAGNLFE